MKRRREAKLELIMLEWTSLQVKIENKKINKLGNEAMKMRREAELELIMLERNSLHAKIEDEKIKQAR
jgi:hypothetical protein